MRTLSTTELLELLAVHDDALLLDISSRYRFEKEHIPGSIRLPAADVSLAAHVREVAGDPYTPVVIYSTDELSTAPPRAARELDRAGFHSVYVYEGGVRAWKALNLPVDRASPS